MLEPGATPDQLPAIIEPAAVPAPADTYIVPSLIADLGEAVEFFTANINNDHTRRAYGSRCEGGRAPAHFGPMLQ